MPLYDLSDTADYIALDNPEAARIIKGVNWFIIDSAGYGAF